MPLNHGALYSTYAGCASAGYALSGFIPSIFFNMVHRRVDLGHESLWSFAFGAMLNIVGLIEIGGSGTQLVMSGLHEACVVILFIQLQYYGYDPATPEGPSKQESQIKWYTRIFVPRIRDETRESKKISKRDSKRWQIRVLTYLGTWNPIKKIQLIALVQILSFFIWFGTYVTRADDPTYNYQVDITIHPIGMTLGCASIAVLVLERLQELRHHRKHYSAWKAALDTFDEDDSDEEDEDETKSSSPGKEDPLMQEPTLSFNKIVFWSLLFENVAQLVSIVKLSQHTNYLVTQIPWLLLTILPICLDLYSVGFGVLWKYRLKQARKARAASNATGDTGDPLLPAKSIVYPPSGVTKEMELRKLYRSRRRLGRRM